MPFHDNVYYPYSCDTKGTHSSAGIPSMRNSPPSQSSVSAPVMTPSSGASAVLPFKFRPRRESVDWRQINAVDIDSVMSQVDVDALQEHISTVTFCSLEGERCQRCRSPVDQALVKLFQLAQLTVEWLLHCQEFLTLNLRTEEQRLVAAGRECEKLLAQQRKQEENVKALNTELKHRKKIIRTQQSLFTPQINNGLKCPQCDKSFLNAYFLQSHMRRRHLDEYESQLSSDTGINLPVESLKLEVSSLKQQILQHQQELQAKTAQEKEQQSVHKDLLREIDRFKSEEMARMDRKLEDNRDVIRRDMEYLYSRNIKALNEANQNHISKHEKSASPVHSLPERDVDSNKEMQFKAIQKLEQQMKKQDKKWESRLQDIKVQHESEKNRLLNELNRMQSFVSDHQEQTQRLQQEMDRQLREKEQTIKAQREKLRNITSNPTTKIVERPVIVSAPALEPKPKSVVPEEPNYTLKLDPIQELSEEDRDSSSFSEKIPLEQKPETVQKKKQRATSSFLKMNASIKKDVRHDIEQTVMMKMESLGVNPHQTGLENKTLASIHAKLHSRQESFSKGQPDYRHQREEIVRAVEQKLDDQRSEGHPALESQISSRQSVQVMQIQPRSSSLPSRTQVMSGPVVKQPKTPQPTPRFKTTAQPKTSTPATKTAVRDFTPRAYHFSSDESEEEETDEDQEQEQEEQPPKHQIGRSPSSGLNQPVPTRVSSASPGRDTQSAVRHSLSSNHQQIKAPLGGVTKMAVTKMESDEEEWSDVSELVEINPRQVQSHKDQNSNIDKMNFSKANKINDLAKKLEKQFVGRTVKKPSGGVSVLPERRDEDQELKLTDLEESSEWMVSSLEDRQGMSKPAQGSGALRKSLDSSSTSIWGTSTGKAPKSGLTEAGTGSTLKSSLYSLSDISDSEDISSKY